jgi:hypothetical protein
MISVLFVAKNSVYKTLGVDCWDEDRDAMKWPGGNQIVAHPPCRLWSLWMRQFSTAPITEKACARFSVGKVRRWGGVIEHPACSTLWDEMRLPKPGSSDQWGISIAVKQFWWGHRAEKATWLYICGCSDIPEIPFKIGEADAHCCWSNRVKNRNMRRLSKDQRNATPPEFAKWLIAVAERCHV